MSVIHVSGHGNVNSEAKTVERQVADLCAKVAAMGEALTAEIEAQ